MLFREYYSFYHMKKLYIVANWKSNLPSPDAITWLHAISDTPIPPECEVIVCPPFILLSDMRSFIKKNTMPITLGAQNISPFTPGAYTGEINAKDASAIITHAIVGHSERRKYFGETDEEVIRKVERLVENGITPILCVSDMKQMDYYVAHGNVIREHASEIIFVYEPPGAISGGGAYHPENPDTANRNAKEISNKIGKKVITLYGGSVNPDDSATLFSQTHIDGGLIGKASLDPVAFTKILQNR